MQTQSPRGMPGDSSNTACEMLKEARTVMLALARVDVVRLVEGVAENLKA